MIIRGFFFDDYQPEHTPLKVNVNEFFDVVCKYGSNVDYISQNPETVVRVVIKVLTKHTNE